MIEESTTNFRSYNITWPYIAGFIDCDGWITHYQPQAGRTRIMCGLTQSVERSEGMEAIRAFLESNDISAPLNVRKKNWKSDIRMINITVGARSSVIILLEKVLPYLVLKRDRGQEALELALRLERERLRKRPREEEIETVPTRSRKIWTVEEIEVLKAYTAAGYNLSATAAKLKRTPDAVSGQRYRLGIKQGEKVNPKST